MADLELNSIGNGDGNNYLVRDNTKIPLSGSNQISGDLIPSSDGTVNLGSSSGNYNNVYTYKVKNGTDNKEVRIYGGNTEDISGVIAIYSANHNYHPGRVRLVARTSTNSEYELSARPDGTLTWTGNVIRPNTDNTCDLGSSTYAFSAIYLGTYVRYNGTALYFTSTSGKAGMVLGYSALLPSKDSVWSLGSSTFKWNSASFSGTVTCQTVVQTSDYRLKDEIESISDDVLNAWENLEPKQYKLKSDLENDKENAQVHYGWIAQDVESIIKGDRKGEVKNGLWLHESWEEQQEVSHEETYTEETQTKDGSTETVTKTRKVIDTPYKAKGDSYGLRYTECLVVECAYLRRENNKLKQLLQNHEERLKALEK